MEKIRLLYIFTSGTFSSANNKQWFKIFYDDPRVDVSILISDCPDREKQEFYSNYKGIYNVLLFKPFKEMMQSGFYTRLKYVREIARKIDTFAPDIIHVHGCYYSYLVKPLFFLKARPRIIYNAWGNDYNSMYQTSFKHRLIINYLLKRADLVWANWFAMAHALRVRLPKSDKIKTIFWGLEKEAFQKPGPMVIKRVKKMFNIPKSSYLLVYGKGFSTLNNQIKLLQAAALVDAALDYKLILHYGAESPDMDRQIDEFIAEHNLRDKVIVSHNRLSDEEMKALLHVADLSFVIPQKDQFTRTITETIFMGTNLILSDIEPYRYLKTFYGFTLNLLDVNETAAFAQVLERFITDRPTPDWAYEQTVLRRIFDFEAKADIYLDIYRELIMA